jgi:hypothetical protein
MIFQEYLKKITWRSNGGYNQKHGFTAGKKTKKTEQTKPISEEDR